MLRQKPAFQLVVGRRLQASAGFESRLLLLLLFYAVATPIVLLILSSRLHSHSRTSSLHGPADPYGWGRVRNWAQNWQTHQTRSLQSKQVSRVKQGHLDTRLLVDKLAEQRHGSIIKSTDKLHGGSHQLHAPINKSKMPAVRPKTTGQTDIRPIKRRKVGDFMVKFYAHVSELCFLPRTVTFQTDALWNALCLAEETLICRTFYSNCFIHENNRLTCVFIKPLSLVAIIPSHDRQTFKAILLQHKWIASNLPRPGDSQEDIDSEDVAISRSDGSMTAANNLISVRLTGGIDESDEKSGAGRVQVVQQLNDFACALWLSDVCYAFNPWAHVPGTSPPTFDHRLGVWFWPNSSFDLSLVDTSMNACTLKVRKLHNRVRGQVNQ